jgi:tetratricopeptide (TPR) repeat protein
MQNLASVLTRLERPAEALPLFREVYEHTKTAQNPSHPRSLITAHNYARTLTEAGDATQAEDIYREILTLARQVFGPDHYLVATFEGGLGVSLLRLGRFQEAEHHLLFSHKGLERAFGTAHPSVKTARQRLVKLYQQSDRPEEATRFLDP